MKPVAFAIATLILAGTIIVLKIRYRRPNLSDKQNPGLP